VSVDRVLSDDSQLVVGKLANWHRAPQAWPLAKESTCSLEKAKNGQHVMLYVLY